MKNPGILLVLIPLAMACNQPKTTTEQSTGNKTDLHQFKSKEDVTYPYEFTYEGNPLSRIHNAADPDVHVWDGVVWMYCSQDRTMDSAIHKKGYDAMDGYHVFSSPDMIHWTDYGEIFHSKDVAWGWENGGFLWAPGAARKNGKYYLYFPHKDKQGEWRVGVATADSPTGPFTDSGKPLEGLHDIDPKVFIDDDGEAYLYNNPGVVARLKPNMMELAEEPRLVRFGPEEIMKGDTTKFSEGSFMHKKDGVYYYSFTSLNSRHNQGYYAMGDNPYGPFEWQGSMAPKPQGAQNHHSIIEFKGQWYYFYHIALRNLPLFKEQQGRIACYDKLYYNEDGTIKMVGHTGAYLNK